MTSKICSRCTETKELVYFPIKRASRDGYDPRCKDCHREVRRARAAADLELEVKTCTTCKRELPLEEFNITSNSTTHQCRDCHHKYVNAKNAGRRADTTGKEVTLQCTQCKRQRPATEFNVAPGNSTGRMGACKECRSAARKDRAGIVIVYPVDKQTCNHCQCEKPAVDFAINMGRKSGIQSFCRSCCAAKLSEQNYSPISEKECAACKEVKPKEAYVLRPTSKTGLESYCRDCKHAVNRRHRAFVRSFKEGKKCEHCGYGDYLALDFAHRHGTEKLRSKVGTPIEPSEITNRELFLNEMKKVFLLCKMCHFKYDRKMVQAKAPVTLKEVGRARRKEVLRDFVGSIKLAIGKCTDCKRQDMGGFHFDHLPQYIKKAGIARIAGQRLLSAEAEIVDEIKKCELCCANCHFLRTLHRLSSADC
jgi:hypothetical protein